MYKHLLNIVVAACVLMMLALYNGYIIPSSDAATYIEAGMENTLPTDRPVFYGWFIKLFSFGFSLWFPLFIQSIILGVACIDFTRHLLPRLTVLVSLFISLLLTIFTSAGWFSGQLMPDILTPILFLAIVNSANADNVLKKRYYLILVLFAAICHNSHLIILSISVFVLLLATVFGYLLMPVKHVLKIALITVCAWLIVCVPNYFMFNKFVPSAYSHVFLMGKLVENNMARTYLEDECGNIKSEYCDYKDKMSGSAWEFVWGAESPMQKLGGWDACKGENEKVIHGVLTMPKYYPRLFKAMLIDTWRQLAQVEIDRSYELPWFVYDSETPFYKVVARHFPAELKQLEDCRINKHKFNTLLLGKVYLLTIILSLIAAVLSFRFAGKEVLPVYIAVIVFLLINAFVTANFANVLSRLNARAIWLLPFINFIIVIRAWQVYRERKRSIADA